MPESRSALVIATEKHYELAARWVEEASVSIILCQRTSTILLGSERGRQQEEEFRLSLVRALERNVPVHHLVHEDSCLADVWGKPQAFNTSLGDIPRSDLLYVGRYRGVKPMPRLVIVDGSVLGCVFDIDQTQYYYEVDDAPAVGQAGEHMMRFITDKGQEGGFSLERFVNRLRATREASQRVHFDDTVEADEVEIFARFFQKEAASRGLTGSHVNYALGTVDGGSVQIPLAWPALRRAIFFDTPFLEDEARERDRTWRSMNAANEMDWRSLFFSRRELLMGLDEATARIVRFATSS